MFLVLEHLVSALSRNFLKLSQNCSCFDLHGIQKALDEVVCFEIHLCMFSSLWKPSLQIRVQAYLPRWAAKQDND